MTRCFRISSFGRSFLGPFSGCSRPSLRRVLRVFSAARRRWPGGCLVVSPPVELVRLVDHWGAPVGFSWRLEWCGWSVRWDVDGATGVLWSSRR